VLQYLFFPNGQESQLGADQNLSYHMHKAEEHAFPTNPPATAQNTTIAQQPCSQLLRNAFSQFQPRLLLPLLLPFRRAVFCKVDRPTVVVAGDARPTMSLHRGCTATSGSARSLLLLQHAHLSLHLLYRLRRDYPKRIQIHRLSWCRRLVGSQVPVCCHLHRIPYEFRKGEGD
jgi:hypothetical protein